MAQKQVKETKVTCKACGETSFYNKEDQRKDFANKMGNCSKGLMCCSGCWPALFIPNKKEVDLNKCPKCGSRAITKEIVIHDV